MIVKLPAYIEELKDGPHKRDSIRHYKRILKERRKGENIKASI